MAEPQASGTAPPSARRDPGALRSNTAFLFLQKGGKLFLSLAVSVIVARYLGESDFGRLSYALSFVALFGGLASLGLEFLVVRDLVAREEERDALLGTTFVLRLAAGIVLYVALAGYVLATQEDLVLRDSILLVGGSIVLQAFLVVELFFQSVVRARYAVYAHLASLVIFAACSLGSLAAGAGVVTFAACHLAQWVALGAGLVVAFWGREHRFSAWSFDAVLARQLFADSWPMVITAMLIPVVKNVDQVMIKELLDSQQLGNYAVAVTLTTAWNVVPVTLCTSLLPGIVEARRDDPEQYDQTLERLHRIVLGTSILAAAVASAFAEPVVALLFGDRFPGAGAAFQIHVWSIVPRSAGVISSYWLVVEGLQRLYPLRPIAGLVVLAGSFLVLVPGMGIRGAAAAVVLSTLVSGQLLYLCFSRTRKIVRLQVSSLLWPVVAPLRWLSTRGRRGPP
jgi:O-antigen/teichoic acid export membrane protein